ncbi:MAG: TPM domain-containing protein [Candidatus Acidiferrales bacterium]
MEGRGGPFAPLARCAPVLFVAMLFFSGITARAEKYDQLQYTGYVNDFAGVLSAAASNQLTSLCTELDQKANAQIAVVTIHTLEGDSVDDFANRLFEKWGVGPKGTDRGVLILLAVDDHQYHVEVGYGLEGILPDGKVGGFGRQMVPILRQGDYSGALVQLTGQIAGVIAQDKGVTLSAQPTAPPSDDEQPTGGFNFGTILLILFGLSFIFRLLRMLIWHGGARRTGGGGWWWFPPMGGGGGGGWGGGGFGGGGGGGFGGFGGGMSGGGGASGSW